MTRNEKLDDAITYISANVGASLAIDVRRRIASAIEIGDLGDDDIDAVLPGVSTKGAGVYVSNGKARRRALRALLLCQKLYLSTQTQNWDLLPTTWPAITVKYWSSKSETDTKRAIEMYMPSANADAETLVNAAASHRPDVNNKLPDKLHNITRQDAAFPIETTCYRAVQSWLLASGHVSLQWFVRCFVTNSNVPVADQLLEFFKNGKMIDITEEAGVERARREIRKGEIVYMYRAERNGNPKPGGQLGHWMISAGNDMGYGCCNFTEDEAHGTNADYARCQISNQLRALRRGRIKPDEKDWHFVRVFQPDTLETFPSV